MKAMSGASPASIGDVTAAEPAVAMLPPPVPSLLGRIRRVASEKMSYALGDQVVFSLGNMAVAALLARHVVAREFGIYILTQRSLDVAIQLCNVFFWAPFVYNLPRMGKEREPEYLGSIYLQQLVACVLLGAGFLLCARWAATPSRGLYYGTFAPLVLTAGGIVFREFNRRMYFAQMRFRVAFWTDVVTNGLQAAGVYALWRTGRLTVANTLWMLSACAIAVSLYWMATEWRSVRLDLRAAWRDLLLNLKLGRWFFGSNMLLTVSVQANPWVLSGLLGGGSVAAYAVCEGVTNIPRVALVSMQNIMAPMLARAYAEGGKPKLHGIVQRIDRLLMLGSVVCAVAIVAVGPWLARLIYKNVPSNARLVLAVLALNLVAGSLALAKTYGLSAIDKAGLTFYANALGLLAQLSVCYWLVMSFHVPGAAAALLLGTALVAGGRAFFYGKEMRQPQPTVAVASAVQQA